MFSNYSLIGSYIAFFKNNLVWMLGLVASCLPIIWYIHKLCKAWKNRNRVTIHKVKFTHNGICIELENLGINTNSIKSIVKTTGVWGATQHELEGKITKDRHIPCNQPLELIINFDPVIPITLILEFTKTKPIKIRFKNAISQPNSLNFIRFFIEKNIFMFLRKYQ